MSRIRMGLLGVGALMLGFVLVGCGDSAPPPPANNGVEKLSSAEEKMKNEMIEKMKGTAQGKRVLKDAGAK